MSRTADIKLAIDRQLGINHQHLKNIEEELTETKTNHTSGANKSRCMGVDGTGAQHQLRVDGNGRASVDINSGVPIATIGSAGHLPSGLGCVSLGLESGGTARALLVDSAGRQQVAVLGNTEKDGSGTFENLHTDGNGNLTTQVINTISVNAYRTTIGSGATNSHALVNAAGLQHTKIFGNNSGTDVQLKCDANGVLETSGGGGGGGGDASAANQTTMISSLSNIDTNTSSIQSNVSTSSNQNTMITSLSNIDTNTTRTQYKTSTLVAASTAVADGASASGTLDLGLNVSKVPDQIWISLTNASSSLGGAPVQGFVDVEISADNSTFITAPSSIPESVFNNFHLIPYTNIVADTFKPPRYLRFKFTNNDGFGNSTDISLIVNYYS